METVTATTSVNDEDSSNVHATTRDSDDLDSEEAELAAHEAMKATDNTAQSLLLPPPSAKKSWWTRCFGAHKPKPRILGKILQARVLAMGMKGELQLLEEDEEKEKENVLPSELSNFEIPSPSPLLRSDSKIMFGK